MTHDELLANVTIEATAWASSHGFYYVHLEALRAVVELHKPNKFDDCPICVIRTVIMLKVQPYPCPTIQAIDKALR